MFFSSAFSRNERESVNSSGSESLSAGKADTAGQSPFPMRWLARNNHWIATALFVPVPTVVLVAATLPAGIYTGFVIAVYVTIVFCILLSLLTNARSDLNALKLVWASQTMEMHRLQEEVTRLFVNRAALLKSGGAGTVVDLARSENQDSSTTVVPFPGGQIS